MKPECNCKITCGNCASKNVCTVNPATINGTCPIWQGEECYDCPNQDCYCKVLMTFVADFGSYIRHGGSYV